MNSSIIALDYKNKDYRGFVFAVHEQYGMLLLYCTRKRKKGAHYQLPGGHIDDFEFEAAGERHTQRNEILLHAAKLGAARELYEETGIDLRNQLDRLSEAHLHDERKSDQLECELKSRCYFNLFLRDDDFPTSENSEYSLQPPIHGPGSHLMIKTSNEHSGFLFELDPTEAAKKIELHSGGVGTIALKMVMGKSRASVNNKSNKLDNDGNIVSPSSNNDQTYSDNMILPPPPKRTWNCFSCC